MEDAGPRGTRTDCPRQNFLNYPAASRNNSSDSNSAVYEASPTSPRDKQTGTRWRGRNGAGENVRGRRRIHEEEHCLGVRGGRVFFKFDSPATAIRFDDCVNFLAMKATEKFDRSLRTSSRGVSSLSPRIVSWEEREVQTGTKGGFSRRKILQRALRFHINGRGVALKYDQSINVTSTCAYARANLCVCVCVSIKLHT